MTLRDRKKLEKLDGLLREAHALVKELLEEPESPRATSRGGAHTFDPAAYFVEMRTASRADAEARLAGLKQHELGSLFVHAGGPQAERKKPKAWLIDQILWRVFDFERGHEAVRRKG